MSFATHEFIRERRDDMMREWEARVASEAREIELADSALRNHLPELLDELADWLQSADAPGTASVLEPPDLEKLKQLLCPLIAPHPR